ncbi:MAG: thiamine-phosphate kinase [Cellvibrionaceae bacterium]|nr:thiamine-phosphate kinase [Cellvibrionaceae bacterium]
MTEFALIGRYFQPPPMHAETIKGVGDDCALVELAAHQRLAVSMDTLVAGRHFPDAAAPADIARRVFCTTISDLAAVGAEPRWLTLGLTLPTVDHPWLAAFSQSLLGLCADYGCELIGGDTTQGPLSITAQVHGVVSSEAFLRRDAARPGDQLWVTGTLGDGAAALAMLQGACDFSGAHQGYLHQRFYCPRPQIIAGMHLLHHAHAAIDISDGLLADLQHIATASAVDIHLDIQCLPLSDACRSVPLALARQWALTGGDDYQLAFTLDPAQVPKVEHFIRQGIMTAAPIGRVVPPAEDQSTVHCYLQGRPWSAPSRRGYQHFAP